MKRFDFISPQVIYRQNGSRNVQLIPSIQGSRFLGVFPINFPIPSALSSFNFYQRNRLETDIHIGYFRLQRNIKCMSTCLFHLGLRNSKYG